jgi:hypothetical protein
MLRFYKIPVGFCYQRISMGEGLGYHLHCYNAVYLNGKWIKLDARGNRDDIKAEFSLDEPKLAFEIDEELGESDIKGIFASPDLDCMNVIEKADDIQDVMFGMPDNITRKPDIDE